MEKKFDICVDNDFVNILDWLSSHFKNGNWHKHFEVTIKVEEFDYDEDGEKSFTKQNESFIKEETKWRI